VASAGDRLIISVTPRRADDLLKDLLHPLDVPPDAVGFASTRQRIVGQRQRGKCLALGYRSEMTDELRFRAVLE
jgi:hypothetical protein